MSKRSGLLHSAAWSEAGAMALPSRKLKKPSEASPTLPVPIVVPSSELLTRWTHAYAARPAELREADPAYVLVAPGELRAVEAAGVWVWDAARESWLRSH